jgi:hypothetical protein
MGKRKLFIFLVLLFPLSVWAQALEGVMPVSGASSPSTVGSVPVRLLANAPLLDVPSAAYSTTAGMEKLLMAAVLFFLLLLFPLALYLEQRLLLDAGNAAK